MRNLAPDIVRQRLLVEATYRRSAVSKADVERFLRELPAALDLRIYCDPVVYSPGGEGKDINQGYDGFVALIDSGIAVYVWENAKFLSVVVYTCKAFSEQRAVDFIRSYFECVEVETQAF